MGDNGTLWLPEQGSTLAGEVDSLFYFVYWVSLIFFVGVVATMSYFAYKYRRRSEADRPVPVHENKLIETAWIVIPTILVMVVFVWGFKTYLKMYVAPPNAYEIRVQAQKWAWQFEYPNGTITTNELYVPVGRPIKLQMSSVDVLHSFFVPAFRIKHDVVPNRYTSVWFEAVKQDTFQVFCTEYCGTQHSSMLAKVIVQSQDDFNAWLRTGGGALEELPLPEFGAVLYQQQACFSCHTTDGSPGVGPTFQGLFGTQRALADGSAAAADENYLRESILEPAAKIVEGFQPIMPPNYSGLSERELSALIEFIKQQQ